MLALIKTWFGNAADAREENKSQLMLSWLCGLSAVLCIHTVLDAAPDSPQQHNSHTAKMNISHRDLSQLYSYIKSSILNKIILIMKLWWVNMDIWERLCLNAYGDQYQVEIKMLIWNHCLKGQVVCLCTCSGKNVICPAINLTVYHLLPCSSVLAAVITYLPGFWHMKGPKTSKMRCAFLEASMEHNI